jgi:hypothetical protein
MLKDPDDIGLSFDAHRRLVSPSQAHSSPVNGIPFGRRGQSQTCAQPHFGSISAEKQPVRLMNVWYRPLPTPASVKQTERVIFGMKLTVKTKTTDNIKVDELISKLDFILNIQSHLSVTLRPRVLYSDYIWHSSIGTHTGIGADGVPRPDPSALRNRQLWRDPRASAMGDAVFP